MRVHDGRGQRPSEICDLDATSERSAIIKIKSVEERQQM